jgi:hypothetical protein
LSDQANDEVLKRLKKLSRQLETATEDAVETAKMVERSKRAAEKTKSAVRVLDTSPRESPRRRRGGKKG